MSARLRRVVQAAFAEANRLSDEYVSTEHFLLAIVDDREAGAAQRLLKGAGVDPGAGLQRPDRGARRPAGDRRQPRSRSTRPWSATGAT